MTHTQPILYHAHCTLIPNLYPCTLMGGGGMRVHGYRWSMRVQGYRLRWGMRLHEYKWGTRIHGYRWGMRVYGYIVIPTCAIPHACTLAPYNNVIWISALISRDKGMHEAINLQNKGSLKSMPNILQGHIVLWYTSVLCNI